MVTEILKKLPGKEILVIGDAMLDHYIWGDTHRISPEAPVPVVHVAEDSYVAGGAANVAVNIACMGAKGVIASPLNPKDDAGVQLEALMDGHGVRHYAVACKADVPSIVKTRVVVRKQQICRVDREASPKDYALDLEKLEGHIRQAAGSLACIILSDYAKGSITQALFDTVTKLGNELGVHVVVDPKPLNKIDYRGADLLTPNQFEALQLAGIPFDIHSEFPAEEVCAAIWEKYAPKHLMITLGPKGMLLCENGKIVKAIPTFAREVFDVSGAGDTVIAGLACALSTGASLVEAAEFANIAAGVVVAKVGTATVTPAEIEEFYAKHPLYEQA